MSSCCVRHGDKSVQTFQTCSLPWPVDRLEELKLGVVRQGLVACEFGPISLATNSDLLIPRKWESWGRQGTGTKGEVRAEVNDGENKLQAQIFGSGLFLSQ